METDLPLSYIDLVAIRNVVLEEIRKERGGQQMLPEHFQLAEARILNYFLGNVALMMMKQAQDSAGPVPDEDPNPKKDDDKEVKVEDMAVVDVIKEDMGVKEKP